MARKSAAKMAAAAELAAGALTILERNEAAVAIMPYATAMALEFPDSAGWAEWEAHAKLLTVMERGRNWYAGDLMLAADRRGAEFEQRAIQLMAMMNWDSGQLANATSIARSYPPDQRIDHPYLTWSHHQVVSAMPPKKRADMLRLAAQNRWTVKELLSHKKEQEAHKAITTNGHVQEQPREKEKSADASVPVHFEMKPDNEQAAESAPVNEPTQQEEVREADEVAKSGQLFSHDEWQTDFMPLVHKLKFETAALMGYFEDLTPKSLQAFYNQAANTREALTDVQDWAEDHAGMEPR